MTSSRDGSGQKPTRAVRPPPELVEKSRRDSQRPTRRIRAVEAPPRSSSTSREEDPQLDVDAGWFEDD